MKSPETWKPTKFSYINGKLGANGTPSSCGPERFMVNHIAAVYNEFIPKYCSGVLADIGCGDLPMYGYYKSFVSDVIAVDWANSLHKNEHLDITADLNAPPIPGLSDNSVDCIICSDVLEHLYKPCELLSDLNRILKPGGKLLLNVPFLYYVHEAPYDYHRYTIYALRRMFADTGFRILEEKTMGNGPEAAGQFLGVCARNGLRHGNDFWARVLSSFPDLLKWLPVRHVFDYTTDMMPLGYAFAVEKCAVDASAILNP